MAGRTLSPAPPPLPAAEAAPAARRALAVPAALLLPLLFLHVQFQPTLSAGGATVSLSDLAVLAIVVLAAAGLSREELAALWAGRALWATALAFFAWLAVTIVAARASESWYPLGTHLTTAAKYGEYALLAPAAVVLFRARTAVAALVVSIVGWSVVASAVGVVQFLGAHVAAGWGAGRRQPSFLGQGDFGALSGAALLTALVVLAFEPRDRARDALGWAGGVAGVVGLVLAGSLYSVAGTLAAVAAVALAVLLRRDLTRGRAALGGLAVAVMLAGALAMRSGDLANFASFADRSGRQSNGRVQTYAQRTLLAYVGVRIFADHPVAGVGWEGSNDEGAYGPYLAAAHRRFPSTPALAFPSPQHPYGIQNAYVQAAADMGVPGFLLLVLLIVVPAALALRVAVRAPAATAAVAALGGAWTLVAAGSLGGLGLIAGVPTDALLWLGVGLVGAACAARR